VAGFVDATGYMLLSHIYTSNMTGNSIELSMHFIDGRWSEVLRRGWPVLMFVCGLVLSAIVTEVCVRREFLSFSAITLGLEATLIAIFIHFGGSAFYHGEIHTSSLWNFNFLVALLAVAMGLQNQTITKIGALSLYTTHVTGTLTKFGAELSEYIFWLHDRAHTWRRLLSALRLSSRRGDFRRLTVNMGLWIWFVIGAICAVSAKQKWHVHALIAPIIVLIALIWVDVTRPIAASAEEQQIQQH
ncbi:MAG TPA: YoaK family protein, partial [Terriglobales bacterium]|nr:YoaK family protein [Terriglobales bacterium]